MATISLALHDYQHGGVGMLVRCENPDDPSKALGDSWKIITDNVEDHPFYKYSMERGDTVYDLKNPSGLLERSLYIDAIRNEGKQSFPIRVGSKWSYEDRDIWARSKKEVEKKFPGCLFLYGVELSKIPEYSDIDIEDNFTRKYGKNII